MLFVHDPKAIHHIAVKEQDTFQEAEWFTRRVLSLFDVYEDDILTCHPSPVWLSIHLALVFLLHEVPYHAYVLNAGPRGLTVSYALHR